MTCFSTVIPSISFDSSPIPFPRTTFSLHVILDPCDPSPCLNNGTCEIVTEPGNFTYVCTCTPRFEGANCEIGKCSNKNVGCKFLAANTSIAIVSIKPSFCLKVWAESCTVVDRCDYCENNSTCVVDANDLITCECPEDIHGEACDDSEYFLVLSLPA